jgi:hypothetical protein
MREDRGDDNFLAADERQKTRRLGVGGGVGASEDSDRRRRPRNNPLDAVRSPAFLMSPKNSAV